MDIDLLYIYFKFVIRSIVFGFGVVSTVLVLVVLREKIREAGIMNSLRALPIEWLILFLLVLLF